MEKNIPILKETWEQVKYYRKNLNKLDELKEINEKRKKFIKMNTNYKIYNINNIDKHLLDNKFDLSTIHKTIKKINNYDSDYDEYN